MTHFILSVLIFTALLLPVYLTASAALVLLGL